MTLSIQVIKKIWINVKHTETSSYAKTLKVLSNLHFDQNNLSHVSLFPVLSHGQANHVALYDDVPSVGTRD